MTVEKLYVDMDIHVMGIVAVGTPTVATLELDAIQLLVTYVRLPVVVEDGP